MHPLTHSKHLFLPISVYLMPLLLSAVSIHVFVVSGLLGNGSASPVSEDKLVIDTSGTASPWTALLSFVGL